MKPITIDKHIDAYSVDDVGIVVRRSEDTLWCAYNCMEADPEYLVGSANRKEEASYLLKPHHVFCNFWVGSVEDCKQCQGLFEREETMGFQPGYCEVCHAKEIEIFGRSADKQSEHTKAVLEAGCFHPAFYQAPQPYYKRYNYHSGLDKFIETNEATEYQNDDDITGNRVFVTKEDDEGTLRFRLEIDDLPHVIAALNRLVQDLISTFKFPETAGERLSS